jgi:hypothetical protein
MSPENEFSFSILEEYIEEITNIHILKISNKDSEIKQMSEKYESYFNSNRNEITGTYTIVNSK